jgi:uncharacterized membrane protein
MKNRKQLLESIHHFIIGVFLILKGYDKFLHHKIIGSVIFIFGIILLFYFFYDNIKENSGRTLRVLVHLFEGFAMLLTMYVFYQDEKVYLPVITFIAAIGFFLSAYLINSRQNT